MANTRDKSKDKAVTNKPKKRKLPDAKVKKAKTAKQKTTSSMTAGDKQRTQRRGKITGDKITSEERHHMIAIAAYYRAQQRGFRCRCCERDWLEAAAEIDAMV
jgi:Ni/Co efflux regulator RcnB